MTPLYTVPVLIHRLFGRRYRLVRDAGPGSPFPGAGLPGGGFPGAGLLGGGARPIAELVETIDTSHGTGQSAGELRAMFVADASYPNDAEITVNDLWAPAGVAFEVRGVRDHAIASDLADFAITGDSVFRAILDRLNAPDIVNLYVLRDLSGARGFARLYTPHVPGTTTHVVMADNADLETWRDDPDEGRAFRRARNIVTLGHEFGHVLGLPHMPGLTNLMRGEGTSGGSTELEVTQSAVVRYRAKFLSGAESPAMIGVPAGLPRMP